MGSEKYRLQDGSRYGCFQNIIWFCVNYSLAGLVTQAIGPYIGSQITSLEKQFGLSSTKTGLLLSCSEIGYLAAIFFFIHFGKVRHIPRLLAFGLVVYGGALLVQGLLYLADPVSLDDARIGNSSSGLVTLCRNNSSEDNSGFCPQQEQQVQRTSWIFSVMAVCMVLAGMSKSHGVALGVPFIDNNSKDTRQASMLVGVAMTFGVLGPGIAFGLGSLVSSIPVNLKDTSLTPLHPRWIAAWWIGYVVIGALAVLIAIPLSCFPKSIKDTKDAINETKPLTFMTELKDLPFSMLRILRNPAVVSLHLGSTAVIFFFAGATAFAPKYVESQFRVPAFEANIIVGSETLLWAVVGTFCGGLLTSRFKLSAIGCLKLTATASCISTAVYAALLAIGCDDVTIKGLTESDSLQSAVSCSCSRDYNPVCGADNVTYFSPCVAGCGTRNDTTYSECIDVPGGTATEGQCETMCGYIYWYVAVDLLSGIIDTLSIVPIAMATMKLVEPRDKPMAMAIPAFLNSLFGFLPAPLLYGYIIDGTCISWSQNCGVDGACAVYDLRALRFRLKGTDLGFLVAAGVCYIISFLFVRCGVVVPKGEVEDSISEEDK